MTMRSSKPLAGQKRADGSKATRANPSDKQSEGPGYLGRGDAQECQGGFQVAAEI